MKYILASILSIFFLTSYSQANYSGDIAEIIYKKCSSCHRPGEIGPMSLTNYTEVSAWGTMIEYVTSNKIMPPWKADSDYSHFLEENYLTDEEIATIAEWVDNGMLRGDESLEPEFPDFPEGSILGVPDLVLEMEEEWMHKGNNKDGYRYFVFPTNFSEDKVIKTIEFRPGNSKIVHHALIFEDTSGAAAANDAATPEYGFDGFGSFTGGGADEILRQKQFPGYVPGQKPIRFPDGVGQILKAGADIVTQIHYAPWPIDESDRSTINIFFMDESEESFERELKGHIMVPLPDVINAFFIIPANTERTFHGTYEIPEDVSLVNIAPHMHLLGTEWEVWLEKPDGEIVNLIKIPDWDFNWQGSYYFDRYIHAPKGSIINAVASYDNTGDNPNNPSIPPQFVTWGEGTQDEMYFLPIGFVDYINGDEEIIFNESTVSVSDIDKNKSVLFPLVPNPVEDFTIAGFQLTKGIPLDISIYDINGQKIRQLRQSEFFNMGRHTINFSTKNLQSGVYILQVQGKDVFLSQKFIKP